MCPKNRAHGDSRNCFKTRGLIQGILQYTREAVDFLARNGLKAFTKTLKTGTEGIKINTPEFFGIYTRAGKVVSFGPR
jgi:hypothetical protein